MEQLNYVTITDSATGNSVRLSTWTEDGLWWVRITINGVDRAYESMGPVEETSQFTVDSTVESSMETSDAVTE